MAIFRKIHVTFWSDAYVSELKDREKLFFLYLLTNERTTQLGIYEITKRQMAFDLGYSIDTVSSLIKLIEKSGKIRYNDLTKEICIKNWNKYNGNLSKKVKVLTDKESLNIKDKTLIEYQYSIDTVSIHNPPQEQEETKEQEPKEEIPSLALFLKFASDNYNGNFNEISDQVEYKYKSWKENGWHTGKDKKIKRWKPTLLNTMSFFVPKKEVVLSTVSNKPLIPIYDAKKHQKEMDLKYPGNTPNG